jgi:hypothetical protein
MPKVSEVCRQVRSKAAGPFWVTIDLFFDGPDNFARFGQSPALGAERIAAIYGVKPEFVKHYAVPSLAMIKISYPRPTPQGWIVERDLHSGQQYVRLLDVEL